MIHSRVPERVWSLTTGIFLAQKKSITVRDSMGRRLGGAFMGAIVLSLAASQVQAASLIVNFDENGNLSATGGFTTTGVNGTDPFDPGNGLNPLIYVVGTGHNLVDGDVLLTEPGSTNFSDLLRFYFNPNSNSELVIVYSDTDDSVGQKADVGLPSLFQSNLLTLDETTKAAGSNGLFGYTPTVGQQPGAPIPGIVVTSIEWNFTSDGAVPEPASVVLLGCGVGLVIAAKRWPKRSA